MTQLDGVTLCDRCGQPLPGDTGGLASAVVVLALGDDGTARTLHLGLADGCAEAALIPDGLAWRMDRDPFTFYHPPDSNHPDTQEVTR